ncbi:MAG: alkaline phosphatase family protein [Candidatus Hydrogenedentes bacterium]|nr:alkaline phosphatase family protein [Candidatus Hydrogenedentota bacterium]
MAHSPAGKVLVIGLDCAAPRFVFGPDAFHLPNIQGLMRDGLWGQLRSCDPPITVPAWACMTSSKDPGALGCYGFRNRKDYSYDSLITATSSAIQEPRVWDVLSRAGKKVCVVGVPQTYPVRPVNGWLVAGFLAPGMDVEYAYPKSLKRELETELGEVIFDVHDFRTEDKDALLKRIYRLMENRFAVARHLMSSKPWDFFMLVEMGVDRLHHAFWRFCDPGHPKFEPDNPYRQVFEAYYTAVDAEIGKLLALVDDDTAVAVVSDHGARAMHGGFCINQWLINEGHLVLKNELSGRTRIEDCTIDWSKTRAWSTGGYYARVFLNVEGRELEGIITPGEYERFRDMLMRQIIALPGPDGAPMGNKVFRPEDIYKQVNGIAPDLLVYFGDLSWRSVGTVGFDTVYTFDNDTGPDDANHDYYGIFILNDRTGGPSGERKNLNLMDVAPTILSQQGVPVPTDMQGKSIK